jgi:PIN domain nuclease of toxin-antitoxin system
MRLLLDTHIALWALLDDPRLGNEARALLIEPENSLTVSAVSVWEIAIKHSLQRGDMPVSGAQALQFFIEAGYGLLPVTATHAAAVEGLPSLHADPFDRLLVAQALSEPMRLVTRDATVARYGEYIIKV